jgi:hypothetical protein
MVFPYQKILVFNSMKLIRTLLGVLVISPILPAFAQTSPVPGIPKTPRIPSTPSLPSNLNPTNPQPSGDLPNNTTQMRSWVCVKESDRIAVAAKEVKGWKDLIEKQGWKCTEGNTDIPDKTLSFSCEPDSTIGILSVYWLGGKNGKKQLSSWQDDLGKQQGMVCTLNNTQLFDTQNNIIPNFPR